MRIVLLPEYFYPYMGGGEEWFRHVGLGLASLGHSVEVFAFPMSGAPATEVMGGVMVRRVGMFAIDKWQPYLKRAISHILTFFFHPVRNYECDIAIGQGSALLGAFPLLWARHIPTVCVVHDIYGLHDSIRDKGLVKGLARYLTVERVLHKMPFAAWITVSESTKAKLRSLGVPTSKIIIVRNGVDPPPRSRVHADRKVILFLGRLVKHKHPEDFLRALSQIKTDKPWTAKIAGEGELLPELRALAIDLGLESKVQFMGRISEDEKWRLLRSSICLVLPSTAEGWGVVLTEAAATGTPSVAYDIPGVREQAEIVPSIRLVKPRDLGALAAWIQKLLEDSELRKSLGDEGAIAASHLTWDASAKQTAKSLKAIVRGSNKWNEKSYRPIVSTL
ncbi:MAG: glycosyltransferase family 4 protein [Candidatus Bathyarchaeia archaeon]